MFEVKVSPSGTVFFKGSLKHIRFKQQTRQLLLCIPNSIADVHAIHNELALDLALKAPSMAVTPKQIRNVSQQSMNMYGHISLGAISGYPLLIVGTSARTFIHFSQILELRDEQDLGKACTFSIHTHKSVFTFSAQNSSEYLQWINAMTTAFENMRTRSSLRASTPNTLAYSIARTSNPSIAPTQEPQESPAKSNTTYNNLAQNNAKKNFKQKIASLFRFGKSKNPKMILLNNPNHDDLPLSSLDLQQFSRESDDSPLSSLNPHQFSGESLIKAIPDESQYDYNSHLNTLNKGFKFENDDEMIPKEALDEVLEE